jgi:hypothetical protein
MAESASDDLFFDAPSAQEKTMAESRQRVSKTARKSTTS